MDAGENSGAGEKSRTPDLRITNALLYQLSYTGTCCKKARIIATRRTGINPLRRFCCDFYPPTSNCTPCASGKALP
ncbi:MAG: hypothetical protein RL695_2192 [Pseudomonadota bacterium]